MASRAIGGYRQGCVPFAGLSLTWSFSASVFDDFGAFPTSAQPGPFTPALPLFHLPSASVWTRVARCLSSCCRLPHGAALRVCPPHLPRPLAIPIPTSRSAASRNRPPKLCRNNVRLSRISAFQSPANTATRHDTTRYHSLQTPPAPLLPFRVHASAAAAAAPSSSVARCAAVIARHHHHRRP